VNGGRWKRTVIFLCCVLFCGCGYQWVGKETHVPEGIRAVAIPTFVNKTFEPGLEIQFTQAFLTEFIRDRRVKVVDRRVSDTVLEGIITHFAVAVVSFDRSGLATEYQATLIADVTLKRATGEVLWQERNISETAWYRVSSSALTSEANKAVAVQQVGNQMADRIRNRFFSNF
jgi:outer membrane lipopolysaccharide assembly protein LptE/RlpB